MNTLVNKIKHLILDLANQKDHDLALRELEVITDYTKDLDRAVRRKKHKAQAAKAALKIRTAQEALREEEQA